MSQESLSPHFPYLSVCIWVIWPLVQYHSGVAGPEMTLSLTLNRKILRRDSDWPGLSHRPTPMMLESWQRMGVLKLDMPTKTSDLNESGTISPEEAGCCH